MLAPRALHSPAPLLLNRHDEIVGHALARRVIRNIGNILTGVPLEVAVAAAWPLLQGRSMTDAIYLLLAEDEPIVQLATQEMLEEGGYSVAVASTGTEAMTLLEEGWRQLSGLVTDIRLGAGPNGWELGQRARELNPLIAVVYTSGDSAVDWRAHGVPQSVMLPKPYAEAQLLTAISNLLNHAAAGVAPQE